MDQSTSGAGVSFLDRSFCFTGKLADLKRTQAQRETRARGGMSTEAVNKNLDYLVIGSIPADGWKFGTYGNKIAKAIAMRDADFPGPTFLSESEFMDALALCPPTNSGAIDGRVHVLTYSFTAASRNSFDRNAVERLLCDLSEQHSCHVRTRVIPARARNELFAGRGEPLVPEGYIVFEIRAVRHVHVDAETTPLAEWFASRFELIDGVDGRMHSFSRAEGSADYIRLIREVPNELRLPDL